MDWSHCSDVESIPGKVSGAWVIKGSRVQADSIVQNAMDGYTAEEIADDIFDGLSVERVRRVIEYARLHAATA